MIEVYLKKRPGEEPELRRSSKQSVVLGRSKDVDWVLDYPDVSRRHCRLYRDGAQLFVEPLAATNAVLVNQRPISAPTPLGSGDEFSFGMCRIRLAAGAPKEPPKPPKPPLEDEEDSAAVDDGAGVWVREAAKSWERMGRPDRLLLRGVRLQRATERLAAARRGKDASLVQIFYEKSIASRRRQQTRVLSWALVMMSSGGLGSGIAHVFGGPVVKPGDQKSVVHGCVEQKLTGAQAIVEKASTLEERGRLLGGVFAAVVAEESRCRDAIGIEENARALLRSVSEIEFRVGEAAVAIARSPDGRNVAIASEQAVKVFGFSEGEPALLNDSADVTALAWSSDSRWLATGDRDGRVALRDARQPSFTALHFLDGHREEITQISYSLDGDWLATGDSAGDVRLWSMRGAEIGEPRGAQRAPGGIRRLIFDSSGSQLFVHSGELVTQWMIQRDRRSGFGKRKVLAGDVTALEVIRDGSAALTGHLDGQIKMWRPKGRSGRLDARSIRKGSGAAVIGLAFVPGRDEIIAATARPALGLIDLQASVREDAFTYSRFSAPKSRPQQLALDASGRRALTVGDEAAEIWDIAKRIEQPLETVAAPEGGWTAVSLPGQRSVAFFGGDDGVVRGRDVFAESDTGAAYSLGVQDVTSFALDRAGDTIVTLGQGEQSVVRTWSLGIFGQPSSPRRIVSDTRLSALAVSGDGRLVAGCAEDHVLVWDLGAEGKPPVELAFPGVERLSFAGEGLVLIAAGPERLRRWKIMGTQPDRGSAEDVAVDGRIFSLAASDTHLAVGTESKKRGEALAWQLLDLQNPVLTESMARPVHQVGFSVGGGYLAVSSKDNLVKTWRLQGSEAEAAPSFTTDSQVTALTFSDDPEDPFAAVGTRQGTVSVWSLTSDSRSSWQAHTGQINGIAFGAGPDTLITADNAGEMKKWFRFEDAWSEGDSVMIAEVSGGVVQALGASGGRALAVLLGDGAVQSWPVDAPALLHRSCASIGWLELSESDWRQLQMKPRSLCSRN